MALLGNSITHINVNLIPSDGIKRSPERENFAVCPMLADWPITLVLYSLILYFTLVQMQYILYYQLIKSAI